MRISTYLQATGIVLLLGGATLAFAQGRPGAGSMHRGAAMHYNAASETTFTGTVDEVRQMPATRNGVGGLHLMVRADGGLQEVALGPASFITSKHVEFTKGDSVTITGVKTTMGETEVVIAREIKKGDQVLTLRDEKGFPLWMRGMRRPS